MPKFTLLVRATPDSDSGKTPNTEQLTEMMKYNKELADAGILHAANGFLPSNKGARVNYGPSGFSSVVDGPFELSTITSGFWVISASNLQEAVDWAKKIPFRTEGSAVEVRQIAGMEDFGDQATGELKDKSEDLKKQMEQIQQKG